MRQGPLRDTGAISYDRLQGLPDGTRLWVPGDQARQIALTLQELLDNAVKYRRNDGIPLGVKVSALYRPRDPKDWTKGGRVQVTVIDNGEGIPKRIRKRVFPLTLID